MDTFENASPPQEQPEMVLAECWECGQTTFCYEHIACVLPQSNLEDCSVRVSLT